MFRRSARVLLALACLVLAGCSLSRLAYDHAPPLLAWMVDDYFDLTDGQRDWVRARFERAMAWHRASELPEYRRFLESAVERSRDGISAEESRWAQAEVRSYYRRSMERVLPDIADFVQQLGPEQLAAIEKRFAEENAKIEKDNAKLDERERAVKRAERTIEQFEGWTGRLTASQRDFVATQAAANEDLTALRVADRRRRQAEFMGLLRSRAPRDALVAGLKRVIVETDAGRDPAYAAKLKAREDRFHEMVAALHTTLSPEQRERVVKRAHSYLGDINALVAKASS